MPRTTGDLLSIRLRMVVNSLPLLNCLRQLLVLLPCSRISVALHTIHPHSGGRPLQKTCRNRRIGSVDILCREQCGQIGTHFHVLQGCQLTHQARVWRHNQVMNILVSRLVLRGH
uniref:Retrovirus-related Pol polyprotein from type-2 retrotransposable element R2DM n=1 Tax=Schistocephalus solidus TaxID=70667 RepID=A0A0X3PYD6_SCHSO